MYRRTILAFALLLPAAAFGQKKDMVELQRDVANLSGDVKALQQRVDEKSGEMKALIEEVYQQSKQTNASVTSMEGKVKDQFSAPLASMSSRMDQMTTEFQALRESNSDLNTRLAKIQAQLDDIVNTIKIMQAPPTPPPPTGQGAAPATGPGGPSAAASATPPAGMSAKQLYDSAQRDRSGGQLDLATQEYQQYLQYYGTTELAPNAQFYIGQIHYDRGEFPAALEAFDAVLERFSENNKTPDAMYMKGMTLLRSGQRNQAATEFLNVIQEYPNSEVADKAKAQRKALGLSVPGSSTAGKKKRK